MKLKGLIEKRKALYEELNTLLSGAEAETRAFTDEEKEAFDTKKAEIQKLDETIRAFEETQRMEAYKQEGKSEEEQRSVEEQRALDEKAFLEFLRGEERALSVSDNGGIIPTSISDRIIVKVKELSNIFNYADVYYVSGDLILPKYDEASSSIGAAYVDDLTELTEGTGKFTTIKLENFIIGSLAKISKSLMNRTDFDLVSFTVDRVAMAIAEKLDKECILGTTSKMKGVVSAANSVTTASATAITADELIDLQMTVPSVFHANAKWIMNRKTLAAIRKLKDSDGNYLLNRDITNGFGWTLLGNEVLVDENMADIASAAVTVVYGDLTGLAVKISADMEISMLNEKYATQHAVGVLAYIECDSDIANEQKLAVLKQKTAS